mmetsp:Transcript_10205/g.11460  ORF Transcript_10205/g.11460 Transcript_10205/m.11460 type:complete len:115 (-) Transcript_10205:14-358(-)
MGKFGRTILRSSRTASASCQNRQSRGANVNRLSSTNDSKILMNSSAGERSSPFGLMKIFRKDPQYDHEIIPEDPALVYMPELMNWSSRQTGDYLSLRNRDNFTRPMDKVNQFRL